MPGQKKISELESATMASNEDLLVIVQGGISKKIPVFLINQEILTALESKEDSSNKVNNFSTINNSLYPSVEAVENRITSRDKSFINAIIFG
jgi:hypothetical protein